MGMIPEKDQWEAGQFAVISTADAYCYARFDFVYEAWDWTIEHMPKSLDDKEVAIVELTTTSESDYSFWRKLEVSNFEKRLNGEPEDKWYVDEFGYPCQEGMPWNKKRSNKPIPKDKPKDQSFTRVKKKNRDYMNYKYRSYRDRSLKVMVLQHIGNRIYNDLLDSRHAFDVVECDESIIMNTKVFMFPYGVELYDDVRVNINILNNRYFHPRIEVSIWKMLTFMFSIDVCIEDQIAYGPDKIYCPVKIHINFHEEDSRLDDMIMIILYGIFGSIRNIPHKETKLKAVIPYVNIAGQYYRCSTIIKDDEDE